MDEQAAFEARAVLAPRRPGWDRLAVMVPLLAFALTAWVGLSGPRSDADQAAGAAPTSAPMASTGLVAVAPPTPFVEPNYPATVLGFDVRRLDDIQPGKLGRGQVTAIAGWFVATSITDCPPLAAVFRPEAHGKADSWAYCARSGTLYASRPGLDEPLPTHDPAGALWSSAGPPLVAATLIIGVVVPPELELIGATATPVVVLGHFVDSSAGCGSPAACRSELAVDYVPWAAGTERGLVIGSSTPAPRLPRLPADGVNVLTGG